MQPYLSERQKVYFSIHEISKFIVKNLNFDIKNRIYVFCEKQLRNEIETLEIDEFISKKIELLALHKNSISIEDLEMFLLKKQENN